MYLIDLSDREREGVRRLLKLPFLSAGLFNPLGLESGFAWYLVDIQMNRLSDCEGDVDILAGRLSWRDPSAFDSLVAEGVRQNPEHHPTVHHSVAALKLVAKNGLTWPPPVDYLIGIEAKCAYLPRDAEEISGETIKAQKSSRQNLAHIQDQVEKLLMMGFDRVALLDMIATPPASGNGVHAWFEASYTALQSEDAMKGVLNTRLPSDSPAGHWVWPSGSVIEGDESQRGAGAPRQRQSARDNPNLQNSPTVKARRVAMNEKLTGILADFPIPRNIPFVFIDCRQCRKFHSLAESCT